MTLSHEQARTLAIVRELAKGKQLTLDNEEGRVLVMGEDMSIGFLAEKKIAEDKWENVVIEPLDGPIDLAGLNDLLNRHEIWFPVPNMRELMVEEDL